MKIYFIDKTGKNLRVMKLIQENGFDNIERKDTYSFRTTKNDYVVLSEYDDKNPENEYLEKYSNLIIITGNKDKNIAWKLASRYKSIDIIYSDMDEEYIAKRILKFGK